MESQVEKPKKLCSVPVKTGQGSEIVDCLLIAGSIRKKLADALRLSEEDLMNRVEFSDEDLLNDPDSELMKLIIDGGLIPSYLPAPRRLDILRQIVRDKEDARAYSAASKAKESEKLTEDDLKKPLWLTVASTTPIELSYEVREDALARQKELDALGVRTDPVRLDEGTGRWILRMHGYRVNFAWYKPQCSYRETCDGCRFCGLSIRLKNMKSAISRLCDESIDYMINLLAMDIAKTMKTSELLISESKKRGSKYLISKRWEKEEEKIRGELIAEREKLMTELALEALEAALAFGSEDVETDQNNPGHFKNAQARGVEKMRKDNPPIEFALLSDGSFLNPAEVPEMTRKAMLRRIAEEASVHRVTIESRIEYIDAAGIERLFGYLRDDQELELCIGLETTDAFVAVFNNKKGNVFDDFKAALRPLQGLPGELKRRLKLTAYNLVKPAYLDDADSINSSVRMVEDVDAFSKELGMPIEVKHEATVIAKGTYQDFLHSQFTAEGERRFEPPSTFSVAEILARLVEKDLAHLSKFGQRDDMDEFSKVSMIESLSRRGMFSPYDFMVYNALERYSSSRDIKSFLLDMRIPVLESEEFKVWEKEVCPGKESALSRLVKEEFLTEEGHVLRSREEGGEGGKEGELRDLSPEESEREEFQKKLWKILDDLEYADEISDYLRRGGNAVMEEFRGRIGRMFEKQGVAVRDVRGPILVDMGEGMPGVGLLSDEFEDTHADFTGKTEYAGWQMEVIVDDKNSEPQSLWFICPLKAVD